VGSNFYIYLSCYKGFRNTDVDVSFGFSLFWGETGFLNQLTRHRARSQLTKQPISTSAAVLRGVGNLNS